MPEAAPSSALQTAVTIVGNYLSPYVRKVLVCLDLKRVAYRIDPLVPYFGNDDFTRISPERRIPVLIDGELALTDSSVICEYLDERYAGHPLLPGRPEQRARARWLEEYADTRMGEVFIWRLFNERIIKRYVWHEPADEDVLRNTLGKEIPAVLDYLEALSPADGYLFGDIGTADVAIAAFFRNAQFVHYTVDSGRWPKTAAFVTHVLDHPAFAGLRRYEELCLRTPVQDHREALRDAGAPVAATSYGSAEPRRGHR
jgi:glutathione S-transferase